MPIASLGVLAGHELAYAVTRTPRSDVHGYLVHAPQIMLVLTVLSMLGAVIVTRGGRLAFWPFPAVAITGFVVQEHLEQLQHGGSLPLLFDRPVFLIGVAIQCVVALAAWLVARAVLSVIRVRAVRTGLAARWSSIQLGHEFAVAGTRLVGSSQARAPPAIV